MGNNRMEGDTREQDKGEECMSVPSGKTTFTLAEAAELLSCHRETLRRAIRSGGLRAAKLGRGFRISRSDLEAFWTSSGGGDLFGRETEGPPEAELAEQRRPPRRAKNGQTQYTLPVSGERRPETPDSDCASVAGGSGGKT